MQREMRFGLAGIAGAAALLLTAAAASAQSRPPDCSLKDGETRSVVRVLDGDTLLIDGGSEVRLIGALAPRAWDAASDGEAWPLAAAASTALERLVQGRSIELGFAGRRTDRYGRLLAQVFVHDPAEVGRGSGAPIWVQGWLLQHGLARAYSLEASAGCLSELLAHERIAREAVIGLWSVAAYGVRGADEVEHLLERRGTFQIVEGRVRVVSDLRATTFINFGEDVRQDFTISIGAQTRRQMAASGVDPQSWAGRSIRVRGWIERRGGPLIEIHHAGEIEPLSETGEAGLPVTPRLAPPARARSRSRSGSSPD